MRPLPPSPPVDGELLSFAVDLARGAGALTLRFFRSTDLRVDWKADRSPVTEADRAAERFVRDTLARRCPDDAIVGEEETPKPGTSGRRWFVDPVDGTRAFLRGVPIYSTLVAYADEHGPAIGVIHMPALGETVAAGRGRGCHWNGSPARVSAETRLPEALVTASAFDEWPEPMLASIRRSGCRMRTWGDGYGYALVATGRAEAMVDPIASSWDVAPMPVILAEAGGRFTTLRGSMTIDESAEVDSTSGVATNGHVHDELMRVLMSTERR